MTFLYIKNSNLQCNVVHQKLANGWPLFRVLNAFETPSLPDKVYQILIDRDSISPGNNTVKISDYTNRCYALNTVIDRLSTVCSITIAACRLRTPWGVKFYQANRWVWIRPKTIGLCLAILTIATSVWFITSYRMYQTLTNTLTSMPLSYSHPAKNLLDWVETYPLTVTYFSSTGTQFTLICIETDPTDVDAALATAPVAIASVDRASSNNRQWLKLSGTL